MRYSKNPCKTNLKNRLERKKENFHDFKNSGNKNSDPKATNNNGETKGKYLDGTTVGEINFKRYHTGEIKQGKTCC